MSLPCNTEIMNSTPVTLRHGWMMARLDKDGLKKKKKLSKKKRKTKSGHEVTKSLKSVSELREAVVETGFK